jgi:hypothetical protein
MSRKRSRVGDVMGVLNWVTHNQNKTIGQFMNCPASASATMSVLRNMTDEEYDGLCKAVIDAGGVKPFVGGL